MDVEGVHPGSLGSLTFVECNPNPPVFRSPVVKRERPIRTKKENLALLMKVRTVFENGQERELNLLVDTGAESNIVRRELVPEECWHEAKYPITLTTANKQVLAGGRRVCFLRFRFLGFEIGLDGARPSEHQVEGVFYEAAVDDEVILPLGGWQTTTWESIPRSYV